MQAYLRLAPSTAALTFFLVDYSDDLAILDPEKSGAENGIDALRVEAGGL